MLNTRARKLALLLSLTLSFLSMLAETAHHHSDQLQAHDNCDACHFSATQVADEIAPVSLPGFDPSNLEFIQLPVRTLQSAIWDHSTSPRSPLLPA